MDDNGISTAVNNTINKRLLNRIAVPPEIAFVELIKAAVDYGNKNVYKYFKLRLAVEYLVSPSSYCCSIREEVAA